MVVSSRDIGATTPDGDSEYINFYTAEASTSAYRPHLSITYTPPNNAPYVTSCTLTNPYSGNQVWADDSTAYTFRVVVGDADGYSNISSVELRLANATDSTSPYDSLKFKWTRSTDTFTEEADTQSAVTITSTSTDSTGSGTSWTLDFKLKFNSSFLNKSTDYAGQVYVADASSDSDLETYSALYEVVRFSSISTPTTPYCEGQTTPAYNVLDTTPEFSAIFGDSGGATLTHAQIQVGTDTNWTVAEMWDSGWVSVSSRTNGQRCQDISYAGSSLTHSTNYYWRIQFKNNYGDISGYTITQTFSIDSSLYNVAPSTPSITDPTTGSVTLLQRPTFTFTYHDANGDPQTGYQIVITQGGSTHWDSGDVSSSSTSVQVPEGYELTYGLDYYVRVRVTDGQDWSSYSSDTYYVHANQAPNTPTDPNASPPVLDPMGDDIDIGITADPDGDTLNRYRVQIYLSTDLENTYYDSGEIIETLTPTTLTYTIPSGANLNYNTSYVLTVSIRDSYGTWSAYGSIPFSTANIGSGEYDFTETVTNTAWKVYHASLVPVTFALDSETELTSGEYEDIEAEDASTVSNTGTTNYYGFKFKFRLSETEGDIELIRLAQVGDFLSDSVLYVWDDTNSEWDSLGAIDGGDEDCAFDIIAGITDYVNATGDIYLLLLSSTNADTNGMECDYVLLSVCVTGDGCKRLSDVTGVDSVSGDYGDAITIYGRFITPSGTDITTAYGWLSIDIVDDEGDGNASHEYNENDGLYYNIGVTYNATNGRYERTLTSMPEGTYTFRWVFVDENYETQVAYGVISINEKLKLGVPVTMSKTCFDEDGTFSASMFLTDYSENLISGATVVAQLIDNMGTAHTVTAIDQNNGYYSLNLDLSTLTLANPALGTWTLKLNATKAGYSAMDEDMTYTTQVDDISVSCTVYDADGDMVSVVQSNQTITLSGSALYKSDTTPVDEQTVVIIIEKPSGSVIATKTAQTNASGAYSTTYTFSEAGLEEGIYIITVSITDSNAISSSIVKSVSVVQVYGLTLSNWVASPSTAGSKTDVTFSLRAIATTTANTAYGDVRVYNVAGNLVYQATTTDAVVTTTTGTVFTLGTWDTAQNPAGIYTVMVTFYLSENDMAVATYTTTYTVTEEKDGVLSYVTFEDGDGISTLHFLATDTLTPSVRIWNNGNVAVAYDVSVQVQGKDSETVTSASVPVGSKSTATGFTPVSLAGMSGTYTVGITLEDDEGNTLDTRTITITVYASRTFQMNSVSTNALTYSGGEGVYFLFETENLSVSGVTGTLTLKILTYDGTVVSTIYNDSETIAGSSTFNQSMLLELERKWTIPLAQTDGEYIAYVSFTSGTTIVSGMSVFTVGSTHQFTMSGMTYTPSQSTYLYSDGISAIRTKSMGVDGTVTNTGSAGEVVEIAFVLEKTTTVREISYRIFVDADSSVTIHKSMPIPDSYVGGAYTLYTSVRRVLDEVSGEVYNYSVNGTPEYVVSEHAFVLETIALGTITSASYTDSANALTIANPSTTHVLDGYVEFEVRRENPDGTLAIIHSQTQTITGVPISSTKALTFVWSKRLTAGTYYITATMYTEPDMLSDIHYYTLPFSGTVQMESTDYAKQDAVIDVGLPFEKTVTLTNTSNVVIEDYEVTVALREADDTGKVYLVSSSGRVEQSTTRSGSNVKFIVDSLDVGSENSLEYIVVSLDSGVVTELALTRIDGKFFDSQNRQCDVYQITFRNQNADEHCNTSWQIPSGSVEVRSNFVDGTPVTIASAGTVSFEVMAGSTKDLYVYKLSSGTADDGEEDDGFAIDWAWLRYVLAILLLGIFLVIAIKYNGTDGVRKRRVPNGGNSYDTKKRHIH